MCVTFGCCNTHVDHGLRAVGMNNVQFDKRYSWGPYRQAMQERMKPEDKERQRIKLKRMQDVKM